MNRLSILASSALLVLVTVAAQAKLTGSGGTVEFAATGPAGLKINGKGSEIRTSEEGANLVVTVPLAKIDTGIGLRNQHMRDKYLETSKYPNAVLTVAKSAITLGGSGDATGTLALHGKQKPVKFHYDAKKDGDGYAVKGSVHVVMTEFGIEQPSLAGASVKPDVDVNVTFRAKDQ